MALRLAVVAALAALAGSAADPAPAMFGPWYSESLRGVYDLSEIDAAGLERRVAANPDDQPTRLKLMAYYQRGDRASRPADRAKRASHSLWLIQHHPDSQILHSPYSRFTRAELSDTDLRRATTLWAAASRTNGAVQWNAASFFESLDADLFLRYLESAAAADPNRSPALRPLAHLYALKILERGPLAQRAQVGLDASKNVWVLGNAAYMLQSQYNQSLQSAAPNPRARELAEKYFQRAQAIDPNLDRNTILPQLDLKAVARAQEADRLAQRDWQRRSDEAAAKIRRLSPRAFGNLPAGIVHVLETRNCKVPQPEGTRNSRNVIRGEFVAKGEAGWAVLCSVNRSTTLLVFRNDNDTNPQLLGASEDQNHLQSLDANQIGYSREITSVGREFIIGHYRAYGGPEPPPIDHQGIDDAFLGKASVTLYFHNGKWLRLQGAD